MVKSVNTHPNVRLTRNSFLFTAILNHRHKLHSAQQVSLNMNCIRLNSANRFEPSIDAGVKSTCHLCKLVLTIPFLEGSFVVFAL